MYGAYLFLSVFVLLTLRMSLLLIIYNFFLFTVPEISEALCRTYTSSIQLHSSSPLAANADSVIHYLLYREASVNKIWKSIPLCCRVEHRVFGLESDTVYDLAIMACNRNGECHVSNIVTLKTECAAY